MKTASRRVRGDKMIFSSISQYIEYTHAFLFTTAVYLCSPALVSAGAQGPGGPPPPVKPVVSLRYGGAYNGPRYNAHRTILGSVKDEEGQAVSSAMVYMKDVQAKSTVAASVDSNGAFRFGSLSLDHDYEIWAEAGELKSPVRSVTTFMTQNEVTMPLLVRAERNHGTPTLKQRTGDTMVTSPKETPTRLPPKSPAAEKQ